MIASLLISACFAASVPTRTATPHTIAVLVADWERVTANAMRWHDAEAGDGPFRIVTVSRTPTPKPNPEATCVVKGHRWYYKDDVTYTMWALIPICHPLGTPWPCVDSQIWVWTQKCGRCGLRREYEWREKP